MSKIKDVTLQKIVAHDFRYDPRTWVSLSKMSLHGQLGPLIYFSETSVEIFITRHGLTTQKPRTLMHASVIVSRLAIYYQKSKKQQEVSVSYAFYIKFPSKLHGPMVSLHVGLPECYIHLFHLFMCVTSTSHVFLFGLIASKIL